MRGEIRIIRVKGFNLMPLTLDIQITHYLPPTLSLNCATQFSTNCEDLTITHALTCLLSCLSFISAGVIGPTRKGSYASHRLSRIGTILTTIT